MFTKTAGYSAMFVGIYFTNATQKTSMNTSASAWLCICYGRFKLTHLWFRTDWRHRLKGWQVIATPCGVIRHLALHPSLACLRLDAAKVELNLVWVAATMIRQRQKMTTKCLLWNIYHGMRQIGYWVLDCQWNAIGSISSIAIFQLWQFNLPIFQMKH